MNTIYLHIGTPKTGTTAIQNFCSENQEVMNRFGYYYPKSPYHYPAVGMLRNAHFLFGHICDEDGARNDSREQELFEEGFAHIYEAFDAYHNIVLSDEGLWNYNFGEAESVWNRIKKEQEKKQFEIKVIVYLRKQDEFLYSLWNQRIKEGSQRPGSQLSWKELTEQLPSIHLDYYDMLERIAAFVGKDNIIVRRFDRKQFVGGTLYADFLDAVGLTYTEEYNVSIEERNISLTQNSREIKRILNKLPNLDTRENQWFRKILAEQSEYHKDNNEYSMFSKEESKAFMAEYMDGNRKVAREYLGEEELFSCDDREKKKWSPENGDMLEDIILFMGSIALQMEKELKEQKKELQEQKRQINGIRNILKHPMKAIGRKIKEAGK